MPNTVEYKEYLFVKVPEDAHDFVFDMGYLVFKIYNMSDWVTDAQIERDIVKFLTTGKSRLYKVYERIKKIITGIKIADGKLQIIGVASDLTDTDWEGIVEKERNFYRLYNFKYWSDGSTQSPTLSGHTLIRSLGFDNPNEVLVLKLIK